MLKRTKPSVCVIEAEWYILYQERLLEEFCKTSAHQESGLSSAITELSAKLAHKPFPAFPGLKKL